MRFTSKILQAEFRLKAGTQQSEREMMQVLQRFQKSDIMSTLDGYSETRVGNQNWFLFRTIFVLNIATGVF